MMAKSNEFSDLLELIENEKSKTAEVRGALKNLDLFVLDNSLRESTVGQLRGHTLDNKYCILKEVKECRFEHIIVSAFSHVPRVDDAFVADLTKRESDLSQYYAFTEVGEGKNLQDLPVGLRKMRENQLKNPIIELDLAQSSDPGYAQMICTLLERRFDFIRKELSPSAKIFINLRDMPFAMARYPCRVFEMVKFLAKMSEKPFGLMYEEPTGAFLIEELSGWTKSLRKLMNMCGWEEGHLLVHVHKKWGFAEVAQLECLASGANGIWASVCEEGAALGHACSAITIMNLVRLGNKKVLKRYNCTYLRKAAISVTELTTASKPHPKQIIYGKRALDLTFDISGIAGGHVGKSEFDMAKFFGVTAPKRITTAATPEMIQGRFKALFGDELDLEMAREMKTQMTADLKDNRKEEYMSHVGLAMLFDRTTGGKLTEKMSKIINEAEQLEEPHKKLLREVRDIWNEWDLKEIGEMKGDGKLEFYSFYNGFMAPYFGCYECEAAKKGLQAIDMNEDNFVNWDEFCVYLKWALREYPKICEVDDLLETAFQKGLIPAMQDESITEEEEEDDKNHDS